MHGAVHHEDAAAQQADAAHRKDGPAAGAPPGVAAGHQLCSITCKIVESSRFVQVRTLQTSSTATVQAGDMLSSLAVTVASKGLHSKPLAAACDELSGEAIRGGLAGWRAHT